MGFFRDNEIKFKWNITWLRIPTRRRQTSWLFTSMAENWNSGLPRTNPASGGVGSGGGGRKT